jgi:homoserine kinase
MADAVFNTAHAALLAIGLTQGNWDLVGRGLADRLHQPHRAHLFPRSMELVQRASSFGALGATISGAGPTVLVWCHYEQTGSVMEALRREAGEWARVLRAPFEPHGADVREL